MGKNIGLTLNESQATQQKDQKRRLVRYLTNPMAMQNVMEDVAKGVKTTEIAKRLNVPYSVFYGVLTSVYQDQYQAARNAHAERLAEKNLAMADKVENLELPPDVAKAAGSLRQWHMERTASEKWGQKSSVNVTHKGVVGLHLEAIRQLSSEPLEAEYEEVADEPAISSDRDVDGDGRGDGGDSDDADPVEDHPLL